MSEELAPLVNCQSPKEDICEGFNQSTYYNICTHYEQGLKSEFGDPALVCDFLTLFMYVTVYCNQLGIAGKTEIMVCVQKYVTSAGICASVYNDIFSILFKECFHFFADNIADISPNNSSVTAWFWETLETVCTSPNASNIVPCSGVQNVHVQLFNITWYCKSEYVFILNGYVCPILACFVLITNTIMIVVMHQVFKNVSLKLLLGFHALVDILGPLMMSLIFFPFIGLGYYENYMEFHWCIISVGLINILTPLLHGESIWLLLGLTMQRFLVVKFPLKTKTLGGNTTKNIVVFYIICVFLFLPVLFINDIQFLSTYEMHPVVSKNDITKTIYTAKVPFSTELLNTQNTSYTLRSIFIQVIPTSLILMFEIGLVLTLRKQHKKRKTLAVASSASDQNLIINVLTAFIVAAVLLVEIPTTFFLLYTIRFTQYGFGILSDTEIQNYGGTLNMLTLLIYQTNLIVCCCISRNFRTKVVQLFKFKCK